MEVLVSNRDRQRVNNAMALAIIFVFINIFTGTHGGPVAETPHFQCRESESDLWSGNEDPTCCVAQPKINTFFF